MKSDRFSFSTNRAHNGAYLVYINGIEVPTLSASVRYGVWQIPECSITMAPDPVLERLGAEDRVQVAVFFLDDFNPQPNEEPAVFRLMMEGEIVGWGYQNTPNGRAIQFTVVNQIAIFTQLFIHFLQNLDDLANAATAPNRDVAEISAVHEKMVFPYSLFNEGLNPTKGSDTIKRPFDFVYNLVRSMTSTAVPDETRSVPAANFFTRWAHLQNFINRFVATPMFDEAKNDQIFPALRAMQGTSVIELINRNLIEPVQNSGSMWDVLQGVLQTMFTELAMIPTAPLVNVKLADSTIQETHRSEHNLISGATGAIASTDPNPTTPKRLLNYFVKPQLIFGLPPACNVIFPSQIKLYSYDENYATQPTRLYFNEEALNKLLNQNAPLGQTVLDALAIAYPEEANAHSMARRHVQGNANGKNFLLAPEEFFKGPVLDRRSLPSWLYFLKMFEFQDKVKQQELAKTYAVRQNENEQAKTEPNGDPEPTVEKLYAEYEFYRERYSRRNGSVVFSGFQPFILPGFPCAIFDNDSSAVHVFGYITSVQQTLSARGLSTQIAYSYGRTFHEVLDKLNVMFQTEDTVYAMAPREPIPDVRYAVQEFDHAESFYNALLFGRSVFPNQMASFNWTEVVGYAPDDQHTQPEKIFMQGATESQRVDVTQAKIDVPQQKQLIDKLQGLIASGEAQRATAVQIIEDANAESQEVEDARQIVARLEKDLNGVYADIAAAQAKLAAAQAILSASEQATQATRVFSNANGERRLQPLPAYEDAFRDYDAAMHFNWRPVCSLDEYIIFHNSIGEDEVPAFGHPRSVGARFYERIRRLVPYDPVQTPFPPNSDGVEPTSAVQEPGPTKEAQPKVQGLNSTNFVAQTRTDWDSALLAYRNNVYNVKAPRG